MPEDVANKWVFGNTEFPSFDEPDNTAMSTSSETPPKSLNKRMIIVHGAKDSGKTTAIIDVFEALIFRDDPFANITYTFLGGATIGRHCDDIIAAMDIENLNSFSFRLGIFSCGDGVDLIKPVWDRLIDKAKCDVIICSAQSENPDIFSKLAKFAVGAKYRVSSISSPLPITVGLSTDHYRAGIIAKLTDL